MSPNFVLEKYHTFSVSYKKTSTHRHWDTGFTMTHYRQLDLFEEYQVEYDHLIAPESQKKAYYKIWLMYRFGQYVVKKESGAGRHK